MPRRIQLAAAQRHSDGGTASLVAPEAQKPAAPALPVDLIASGEVEPQAPNVSPAWAEGLREFQPQPEEAGARVFIIGGGEV